MFWTMFNSIRVKLTLWYTVVLALVVIAFSALTYFSFVRVLRAETDTNLMEMANNFVVAVTTEQGDEEAKLQPSEDISETIGAFKFRDYQFVVVSYLGNIIAKTAEYEVPGGVKSRDGAFRDYTFNGEQYRVFDRSFRVGGQGFHLYAFHPLADRIALESRLQTVVLVAIPIALLLASLGSYFLVRRSLCPVQKMSEQANQISSQNLHERLPVANKNDELGTLATSFNDLLDRLDKSFEQQRRFMADASHELRTPLAIVRGEAEVALSKNNRSPADYRESLSILHDESKRLTKIVEDLFTLARADAGQFHANFAPVYLDEIGGDAVRSIRVLADQKDIELKFDGEAEMPFRGDESLLRRLFLNLLDNAVKYSRNGGKVSVVCESTDENFKINIIDSGIGISREEQGKIFERFYRVDKARSRTEETGTSGAGLGLSIAKWIVELHDGRIELTATSEQGSTFTVYLPR